ncbi:lipocalin, partial [Acidovorax cattleyae]|nr:lipocalin [Paracidovorax cattleyae]
MPRPDLQLYTTQRRRPLVPLAAAATVAAAAGA